MIIGRVRFLRGRGFSPRLNRGSREGTRLQPQVPNYTLSLQTEYTVSWILLVDSKLPATRAAPRLYEIPD